MTKVRSDVGDQLGDRARVATGSARASPGQTVDETETASGGDNTDAPPALLSNAKAPCGTKGGCWPGAGQYRDAGERLVCRCPQLKVVGTP